MNNKFNKKKSMFSKGKTLAFTLTAVALSLSACTTERQTRGFVIKESVAKAIMPGLDNQVSVIDIFGSPSVRSTFDQNTWYYISSYKERKAFFSEEPVKQTVMVVNFDDKGIVNTIQRFDLSQARPIQPNEDTTPTRGRELGFFEQIFGNIGRFAGAQRGPMGNAPIPQ